MEIAEYSNLLLVINILTLLLLQ